MRTHNASWEPEPAIAGPGYRDGGFWDHFGGTDWAAPRRRPRWRRAVRLVRMVLALALMAVALAALMSAALWLITPSVGNAPSLARALASSHHARYPGPSVPRQFAASLVATEDHRFYSEPGIDPIAVVRVSVGYLTGKPDQGGATLYQQLARVLYRPTWPGVTAEAEQVALGVKLETSFTKPEILQMYADVVYFGHGFFGLDQASCGYFGVQPSKLTWPQAAMLAGIVPAPSTDNPITNFASARGREAHVLGRLVATGILTRAQAAQAYRQPLHVQVGRHASCGGA